MLALARAQMRAQVRSCVRACVCLHVREQVCVYRDVHDRERERQIQRVQRERSDVA